MSVGPIRLGRQITSPTMLLVGALLSLATAGCGQSNSSRSTPQPAPTHSSTEPAHVPAASKLTANGYLASDLDSDRDDQGDKGYYLKASHGEDTFVSASDGKVADPVVTKEVTAMVKRYYAVAAAGDGATACALLDQGLAAGLAEGQEQPGHSGGKTCPYAMAQVLRQQHEQLAADDVATMTVIEVRVKGNLAAVAVGFKAAPVGTIRAKRDHGVWKIDGLIDTGST